MTLNPIAIIDLFVAVVRLGMGLTALVVGLRLLFRTRSGAVEFSSGERGHASRYYLVAMLGGSLLVMGLASWPLTYLAWQSYVPEWPGAMCIYGITRIGAGSLGAARWLPALAIAVQVLKPAILFVAGAWAVVYVIDRRTRTAPHWRRGLMLLVLAGALAATDASAETAYHLIPKREKSIATGCCTVPVEGATLVAQWLQGSAWLGPWEVPSSIAFFGACAGMSLGLEWRRRGWTKRRAARSSRTLMALAAGALASLPIGGLFLVARAAPAVLGLPYHHCAYCLWPEAPDAILGALLFFAGVCATGWALVAAIAGRRVEVRASATRDVQRLLSLGSFGYAAAGVLMAVELTLATR